MLAPINKIPPEILALIPDFLDTRDGDQDVITLTHVCHAWREVFVSRSSLWTNFDCSDEEKTRVYLERSKSSPINLSLNLLVRDDILPHDPFFQIIPHVAGRLKSLFVQGVTEDVEVIISHLSHPAPLLEHLSIRADFPLAHHDPILPSALFNGDLSSLRVLRLESVHTEFPWKNMVNLTSFTLSNTPEEIPVGQLLDFFESTPHLEVIELYFAIPKAGTQSGRVVSLECLKSMYIKDDDPPSVLLDHLLIPVGAKLEIQAKLLSSLIGEHLPRSLDNLKNFSNFTAIRLHHTDMEFSGPNGQVKITLWTSRGDLTELTLQSLAELDTSKTERFEIEDGDLLSKEPLYQALLPMKDLRTLTLSKCISPGTLIHALQPTASSEVMVCPKLEEFILVPYHLHLGDRSDITSITEIAAARASRGGKLKTVRIFSGPGTANLDVSELRKHVWNVEYDYMN